MAVKQQSGGNQPGNTAAVDLLGVSLAGMQNQINALGEVDRSLTSSVSEPEIDTSFTPVFRLDNKGAWVTIGILFPPGTIEIKVLMVITSLRTNQAAFETASFHVSIKDLQADEIAIGRCVRELNKRLYFETQYDIYRLKSFTLAVGAAAEVSNPDGDVLFNDVPLLQFTTPGLFGLPSSPALALIKDNKLDLKTREHDAYVVLRVWAPTTLAGAAQTWAASGCDQLTVVVRRDDVSPTVLIKKEIQITAAETLVDAASTPVANRGYIDVLFDALRVGGDYSWLKNVAYTNGEKKESTGSLVTFIGGNLGVNPAALASVSFTVQDTDPFDGKHRNVSLNLTQPAAVVALKHLKIEVSVFGSGIFDTRVAKFTLRDDEWHTVGAKIIPVRTIKLKHNKSYTLRGTITALGGLPLVFTQNIGVAGSEDVLSDTGVPTGLAAPIIDWTAEGRLQVRNLNFGTLTPDQSQTNTIQKKYLLIWDGAGNYLDIVNKALTTNPVLALFEVGLKSHLNLDSIKKKIYKNVFGSGGNFCAAWLASNSLLPSLGFSAQSANSNFLNVATMNDVIADGSDGIAGLDATAVMNTRGQLFPNSDYTFSRASATSLASVTRRVAPFTADTTITTTTTDAVFWDTANDWIVWRDSSNEIWVPLKKNIKGREILTCSFQVKTDGSFGAVPIITMRLSDNSPTDLTVTPAPITLTGLTTSFLVFGGTIEIIPNLSAIGNRFLVFKTTATLGALNNIIMDKDMLVRGRQMAAWAPRPQYELGQGGTEDPDTTPTATPPVMVDLGRAIGIQGGGWPGEGFGGPLTFSPQ